MQPRSKITVCKNVHISIPICEIKIKMSGIGHQIYLKRSGNQKNLKHKISWIFSFTNWENKDYIWRVHLKINQSCSWVGRRFEPDFLQTWAGSGLTLPGPLARPCTTPQSTYMYREPQCMSPRRNWDSPNPLSHKPVCPHALNQRVEGHTLMQVGGGGVQIPTTGEKA